MGATRAEHGEPLPRGDGPSTTGGIDEGLAAHDVEVGLGRGGAVLVAAEEAAHAPDAPLQGFATIDIAIREGGVLDAHLVNASNDAEGWAKVAGALKHIDPSRLRLPPGSHGWHVTVRLEAKVQFPDGRDPRTLHGWRAGLNPSVIQRQVEGDPEARGSSTGAGGPDHIADPGGHEPPPNGGALGGRQANSPGVALIQGALLRVIPAPTLAVQGKVCSLSISIVGPGIALSGGCSPENIGVGTTRVVSGKIVSEGAL
jgi:hypothetical protein